MKTILLGLPLLFSLACTDDLAVSPSSAANASATEAPPATTSVASLASNFNPDTVAPAPTAASTSPADATSTAAATGHEHHAAGPSAKPTTPKQTQPTQYTCPHHPEVISDKPGECPKCHMDLVPKQSDAKSGHEGHDHGAHQ